MSRPAPCPAPVRLHCTLRATGDQGALSGDDSFTAQASPEVGHHREARTAGVSSGCPCRSPGPPSFRHPSPHRVPRSRRCAAGRAAPTL